MKIIFKFFNTTTFRFIVVGVINTIVGTTIMFAAYNLFNLNYWVSSSLNYIIGSIVSFILNKTYTFKSKEKSKLELFKFVINISICYFIAYGLAKPFIYSLFENSSDSVRDNLAMLSGMVLFVILNYVGQRFVVFNLKKSSENNQNSNN